MSAWPPEDIVTLADNLSRGLSQRQTAAAMGRSHCAIAGKLHRLGWHGGRPVAKDRLALALNPPQRPRKPPPPPKPILYEHSYSIRMDTELRDQVDAYARDNTCSRAEAIRTLLTIAFIEIGEG